MLRGVRSRAWWRGRVRFGNSRPQSLASDGATRHFHLTAFSNPGSMRLGAATFPGGVCATKGIGASTIAARTSGNLAKRGSIRGGFYSNSYSLGKAAKFSQTVSCTHSSMRIPSTPMRARHVHLGYEKAEARGRLRSENGRDKDFHRRYNCHTSAKRTEATSLTILISAFYMISLSCENDHY